jgi:hypothetical protein
VKNASKSVVILLDRLDYLVGNPDELKNCLTVDAYYDKFKSETNLFIKSWPRKHKLVGWYNRLVKNGYHTFHIHPGGWLSGVIYLKTTDLSNNDEGAIEFGLHGYDLPITDEDYLGNCIGLKEAILFYFPHPFSIELFLSQRIQNDALLHLISICTD